MSPSEKRSTWRRITMESSAWRFNRYSERAREKVADATAEAVSNKDKTEPQG